MNLSKSAEREAYALVGETCPYVDAALETATVEIKRQTGALREALIGAILRALEAEKKVEDLEATVEQLKQDLEDARDS